MIIIAMVCWTFIILLMIANMVIFTQFNLLTKWYLFDPNVKKGPFFLIGQMKNELTDRDRCHFLLMPLLHTIGCMLYYY